MLQSIHIELLLRILLGAFLGAIIGVERDLHGRPAGLRTHTIVALASATFMVVSTRFLFYQHYLPADLVAVDPSRIAASVVSGIGFLGAGAIMKDGVNIRGLTTAAGLWLVAAIGMAAGGAMYAIAVFVTLVGLAALTLLRRFEDRGEPIARQRVTVLVDEAQSSVAAVAEALTKLGAVWSQEEFERQDGVGQVRVTFEIRTATPIAGHTLARTLQDSAAIRQIKIERL